MTSRCLKEVVHFFLSASGTPDATCNPPVAGSGLFEAGERQAPGIILLDSQWTIHFISPTAQSLLNLRQEEYLGEPFNYFILEGEKIRVGINTRNKKMGIGEMSLEKEGPDSEAAYRITIREIADLRPGT